ncbi:MAG: thiol-disulfide oxidoreductase DCC family protein [Shewanella sp.]
MELRIFYDGNCPLCRAEMRQLKARDPENKIELVDLNAEHFSTRFSYIDKDYANRILHGETASGQVLLGLDVTCQAWALTGTRPWVQVLRLPLIKPIADWCYLRFAKHRYRISYLLTGKARCDGQCQLPRK